MTADPIYVTLINADTDDEISENVSVPVIPRIGELIHHWQDGFPDAAGVGAVQSEDFEVIRVVHDWRVMPQGRQRLDVTVLIYVRQVEKDRV